MNVEFTARVKQGRLLIEVPQAALAINTPDIVACMSRTKQIVALGQTEDAVRAEAPERWERDKDWLEFRPAFDLEHLEPELAASVLRYYATMAQARIRPGLIVRLIGNFVDRFNYALWLPGYEGLSAKTRAGFVKLLRTFPCLGRFSINGQKVIGS
jgi:hypothetical protein